MNRTAAAAVLVVAALTGAGAIDLVERHAVDAARALRRQSYVEARVHIQDALELAVRRRDAAGEVRARIMLGAWLDMTGDAPGAGRELDRALDRARAAKDPRSQASVLREIGLVRWRHADYRAATRLAREALAIQTDVGDRAGEGASVDLLARIDLKTGRPAEALSGFERAIGLREVSGDLGDEAESRVGLIAAHLERRDYRRAISEAAALERRGREKGDLDVEFEALCQTAIIWMFQSAPDAALESLGRARSIATSPENPALLARASHLEANALRTRGDHAAALAAHDAAIGAYRALGNRSETAWNLARRSRSLSALGRDPEAEASLREALEIWRLLGEPRAEAYWTYEYGTLLARTGNPAEAWRLWDNALRRESEIELPYIALVLGAMADMEARRGECGPARARAADAIGSAERSGSPQMTWMALYRGAVVDRRCGEKEAALAKLLESLAAIEAQRPRVVPTDEALVGFLEDKQQVFEEAVDLLMELGRSREALGVAERARARAFLDLTKGRADAPASAIPRGVPTAGLHGATAIEYFVGRDTTFVWVLEGSGRLHAATLPAGSGELSAFVAELRAGFNAEVHRAATPDRAALAADPRASLRALHSKLWSPIERWLPDDPSHLVTIVPHGPLLMLPFASLIGPDGGYIVEGHTLDYAPSLNVLAAVGEARERKAVAPSGCLVVANPATRSLVGAPPPLPPLPDADAEAAAVCSGSVGGEKELLTGAGATEGAVRAAAIRHGVLHFATHGVYRDDDPLASALLLTPSPGEDSGTDGSLTAREVLDLSLNAQLVVLAACETGRGRVTGEGVLGLSRSFLQAGARSVVVSLWRVSDLAGSFQMKRFYSELAAGAPRAAALRRAQLDTLTALRRGEMRTASGLRIEESPLLWAPFVLIGNGTRPLPH